MDWSGAWVRFSRIFLSFLEMKKMKDEEMRIWLSLLPLLTYIQHLTTRNDHFALALVITLN